ncbi:MAG: tetratricopeptide repeat protein [Candidatus Thorarchaeota archaeon]
MVLLEDVMIMETIEPPSKGISRVKISALLGTILIVSGIVLEWLSGWGYFGEGFPTGVFLGIGILSGSVLLCCMASLMTGTYAAKIPEYGEMEIRFEEAKEFYDNGDWKEALDLFRELMGPQMNHKRALYYAAKCAEKLDSYEAVKTFCHYYLKMQPKDKEAWEMLANAHKKLFEYEEAEDALLRAERL